LTARDLVIARYFRSQAKHRNRRWGFVSCP
jgi:hypothetical protein